MTLHPDNNPQECNELKVVLITHDSFFALAVEHVLNSLMPEILSRRSDFCNLIHYKNLFDMDVTTVSRGEKVLVITDYDVRMDSNLHILDVMKNMAIFQSVMLVTDRREMVFDPRYCLHKDMPIENIKRKLLDFIVKAINNEHDNNKALFSDFTSREREIIRLILKGKRINDIAQKLQLSPKTVYTHRARVFSKLGVHSLQGMHSLQQGTGGGVNLNFQNGT
ncbi:helix-turn-helix domain-containing protein [Entomohabitans teleogrylli]|uniref:helix-turn-helix domain-containing protein n=1 Tax=Entomohabitans teleogrylli TaxID=1384589 RepID=UPI00073DA819|nr:LuxR C-terminal-related transcriptional regulator [Entomohabitans teleogrylli]